MQGPRKRPFASWSGFRREYTPARAKSLVSLPPVSHFLAAFTRQHFKHALNGSHAGGVSPTQMTALGLGEYRSTQTNDSIEGRAANRRVLLAILQPERMGQSLYSQSRDPSLEIPKAPPPTP